MYHKLNHNKINTNINTYHNKMNIYSQIVKLVNEDKIGYNIHGLICDELYANIYNLLSIVKDSYHGQVWHLEDVMSKRKLTPPTYKGSWNEYNDDIRQILIQNDIEIFTQLFIDYHKIINTKNYAKLDITNRDPSNIIYTIWIAIRDLKCDKLTETIKRPDNSKPTLFIKDYEKTFNLYLDIENNLKELNYFEIEEIFSVWDYPSLTTTIDEMINGIMNHLSQIFTAIVSKYIQRNFKTTIDFSSQLSRIKKITEKINTHKMEIEKLEEEKKELLKELKV